MRGGVNMGRAVETQPMQGDRCFLVVARRHVRRHVDLSQKTSSFASLSLLDVLELALSHFHC
jgi:hypothetical protein